MLVLNKTELNTLLKNVLFIRAFFMLKKYNQTQRLLNKYLYLIGFESKKESICLCMIII